MFDMILYKQLEKSAPRKLNKTSMSIWTSNYT